MENNLEKIIIGDKLLAIILRADFKKDGIEFFTPADYSQQLSYMKRPKDYVVKAHIHNVVKREILFTRETIFIKSGKIRADFYSDDKKYVESRILDKGDVLLLLEGGHGFEFIEAGEIIEVKQGPYFENMDMVRFEPVVKSKLKVKDDSCK
ncbi:MAG: hypothetical protein Q7K98_04205 [Candidatus Omnitrophota bacterium]|nr:hypothetical protein [Candidatus Omnitrophota bacterium]